MNMPPTMEEREAELAALQSAFDEYIASSRELEEELDAELAKMRKFVRKVVMSNDFRFLKSKSMRSSYDFCVCAMRLTRPVSLLQLRCRGETRRFLCRKRRSIGSTRKHRPPTGQPREGTERQSSQAQGRTKAPPSSGARPRRARSKISGDRWKPLVHSRRVRCGPRRASL